jgi:prepilin-type N-terminal cleavage/methylation domain-containing protein
VSHRPDANMRLRVTRRAGFTLVELVVSLAVLSVLLLGAGATLRSALSATDRGNDAASRTRETADAMAMMAADVALATSWNGRNSRMLDFNVPGRTTPGTQDRVVYMWSGVDGDPLTRSYGGGAAVPIINNARNVNFQGYIRAAPVVTTISPVTLYSASSFATGSSADDTIRDLDELANIVFLSAPEGVVSVRVTGVRVGCRQETGGGSGTAGILRVGVYGVTEDAKPDLAKVYGFADINEASLPTSSAGMFSISVTTTDIPRNTPIAIVFENRGPGRAANIRVQTSMTSPAVNALAVRSGDGGASWESPNLGLGIPMVIQGAYVVESEN